MTADYNRDPDALAWARTKIQREIDKFRDWERCDEDAGNTERAKTWRMMRNILDRQFIGGTGCVIAAFDERLPAYARMPKVGEAP